MNFKIVHETNYSFDDEVFLEPHYLRFRPKQTPFIKVNSFAISLQAEPEGHRIIEDEEHNTIGFYWFEKLSRELIIRVETSLQTSEYNLFNFIIHPESFNTLPFTYSKHQQQILYASLQKVPLAKALIDYADAVLHASNVKTIDFVTNLTSIIHKDFTVEYRERGAPLSPDDTFDIKKGSCRDLSWMQINMLRNYGIASHLSQFFPALSSLRVF